MGVATRTWQRNEKEWDKYLCRLGSRWSHLGDSRGSERIWVHLVAAAVLSATPLPLMSDVDVAVVVTGTSAAVAVVVVGDADGDGDSAVVGAVVVGDAAALTAV